MARGWESKAVENQVVDFQTKKARENRTALTPQQAEIARQRDSLLLVRTRVQNDLNSATDPPRREQLSLALAHLNDQIGKLEGENNLDPG